MNPETNQPATSPLTRRMWWVSLLGLGLFLLSGLVGYRVEPDPGVTPAGLPGHMGLAMAAGLMVFVSQGWFALYLLLTHRLVGGSLAERHPDLVTASRRMVLTTVPPALGAVVGTGLLIALGARILSGGHSAALHHGIFWTTLVLGLVAVALEYRVSRRHDALLARVEAFTGEGEPAEAAS